MACILVPEGSKLPTGKSTQSLNSKQKLLGMQKKTRPMTQNEEKNSSVERDSHMKYTIRLADRIIKAALAT